MIQINKDKIINLLKVNGIDSDTIDLNSYASDIPFKDWLFNEYAITLKNNLKEENLIYESGNTESLQYYKNRSTFSTNKEKVKRILGNDLTLMMAKSNEGKTSFLCNLISAYKEHFKQNVWVFGFKEELTLKLGAIPFNSLLELEQIRNSIIVVDEAGKLFDLENRKKIKQIDLILRTVNHNGNKLLLSGIPSDFKKFLCSKATCFIFKGMNLNDLINGSLAKEIINQYSGSEKGAFTLNIPKDEALSYTYKEGFFIDKVVYLPAFDTKKSNKDLFYVPEIVPKKLCAENIQENVKKNVLDWS